VNKMSHTRYINSQKMGSLYFTPSQWEDFKAQIEKGCTFTCYANSHSYSVENNEQKKVYTVPNFTGRYYEKEGIMYYHISNDDRRHIIKFLRSYNQ
jgi:hypothetical protein